MALGRKTGGRVAGAPNRRTVEVMERLQALGCDPIGGMARLAMDDANPPELGGRMFAELAQYVAPKRKAVEDSAEDGSGSITGSWMSSEDVRSLPASELVDHVLQRVADGDVPAADVPQLMDSLRSQIGARVS
jgi:hypothetical protein